MMRRFLFTSAVLGLGLLLVASGQGQTGLSEDEAAKLIAHDAKNIQDLLAKKLDTKRIARVKMAALMIAAYAQEGGMEDVREQALKLLKAVEKDPAEAKKLAADLKPGKGGAKLKEFAPASQLDIETFMKMFSGERVGGFALEAGLDDLADVKGPLGKDAQGPALVLVNKIATIGHLLPHYTPKADEGPKTKQAWNDFSKAMQSASTDLVGAVRKNDGISAAATKLGTTCTKCHDVFRVKE